METMAEKINKMVCTRLQEHQSKIGYNEGINIEYFATDCAIEQDRIARQEERERCIKAAQNAHCECCSHHEDCRVFNPMIIGVTYPCNDREEIRKALEGGNQ